MPERGLPMSDDGVVMSGAQLRALLVLAATFVAGALAGGAIDRAYTARAEARLLVERPEPRRAEVRHHDEGGVPRDQIPTPLYSLGLTPDEQTRLAEIARRWRPQAS